MFTAHEFRSIDVSTTEKFGSDVYG